MALAGRIAQDFFIVAHAEALMTEFWQLTFPVPGRSEAVAKAAEAAGWDGLAFADTQCLSGDIYSAMCLAAKATERLRVGSAVTNPVTRHAAVTASAIATVQVESNGRAVLGIGRGDSSLGYIGQGPAPAAALERYISRVQGYLSGEPVMLDGFESRNMWIAHAGQPKVPVDVAATGPRVIDLAARLAERVTFAMGADPARLAKAVGAARAIRERAGLDSGVQSYGAYVNIACDDDVTRGRDVIRGSTGTFAHFSGMSKAAHAGIATADADVYEHIGANYDMANHASGAARHMQAVPDGFIDRFAIVGGPGYCIDRLGELIATGLERLVLLTGSRDADPGHVAASMARISEEVIPALR